MEQNKPKSLAVAYSLRKKNKGSKGAVDPEKESQDHFAKLEHHKAMVDHYQKLCHGGMAEGGEVDDDFYDEDFLSVDGDEEMPPEVKRDSLFSRRLRK